MSKDERYADPWFDRLTTNGFRLTTNGFRLTTNDEKIANVSSFRAFVAVELPDSLRNAVARLQTALRAANADVAWVAPANLHVTLKFLGNIEVDRVDALAQALRDALQPHAPFRLAVEGIGAFPGTRNPRILWVGATEGACLSGRQAPALAAVARAVEHACATLGYPAETRPFAAHLTIGRVRSRHGLPPLVKALQTAKFHGSAPVTVDHLTLVQSTLSPKGSLYTPLAILPLRG